MTRHHRAKFESETVVLDGSEFTECEFRHCNLVYKGHDAVKLEHCHIVGGTWQFEGAALRTVMLLKGLYLTGHAGKEVVEAIFRQV
jgi:hypothetical protein